MPRRPRYLPSQGTFHLCNRGACRQALFLTTADREFFLVALERVARDFGWRVLAVCLMGNHFHVVVETPHDNLVKGTHLLLTRVAIRFNREHGRSGHVFESRFKSPAVESQDYLEYLLGYVAMNPVKAGFCQLPEEWEWSSFAAVTRGEGTLVDTDRLFDRLAGNGGEPLDAYRRCVQLAADAIGLP